MARFVLSDTQDWELVHDHQDIRRWPVHDADDHKVGNVTNLIADTRTELVEGIVLDSGAEVAARDVRIGDGVVYVVARDAAEAAALTSGRPYEEPPVRHRADDTAPPRTPSAEAESPAAAGTMSGAGSSFRHLEPTFRSHYDANYRDTGETYETYAPAYEHGYTHGTHPDHRDRDFESLRPEMKRTYDREHGEGAFERVHGAIRHAFVHGRNRS